MLAFSQHGEGKTVVFLHGFLESSSMWKNLIFPFHCVFIDLPGHGNSEFHNENNPSISFFADKVLEVLNHLRCSHYAIIGHSMGGYVGLELLRRTGYVEKLILLNSNFWEDSQQKKIDRNRIINIVASNKDWFIREAIPNLFYQPIKSKRIIEYLCQEASNMSIEAIKGATLAMRDRESSEDLIKENFNKIKILQGQHDAVIPLELMLAKNNGICNLVVFPDSAHMSHEEVPELVVKEIIQFINIE